MSNHGKSIDNDILACVRDWMANLLDNQPRCSERFADNGAACLYATYLTGANFWVLPHDFVVRVKEQQQILLSSTEVS